MRTLNEIEISYVGGAGVTVDPLIEDPQSAIGEIINDLHEAYINFLNAYAFPYIYYCM